MIGLGRQSVNLDCASGRPVYDQMPPRDVRYKLSIQPVSEPEQELIRKWIDDGAIDPPPPPGVVDDDGLLVSEKDKQWWAFQAPVAAAIPNVAARDRVRCHPLSRRLSYSRALPRPSSD